MSKYKKEEEKNSYCYCCYFFDQKKNEQLLDDRLISYFIYQSLRKETKEIYFDF
jgi:hypothetical protein